MACRYKVHASTVSRRGQVRNLSKRNREKRVTNLHQRYNITANPAHLETKTSPISWYNTQFDENSQAWRTGLFSDESSFIMYWKTRGFGEGQENDRQIVVS